MPENSMILTLLGVACVGLVGKIVFDWLKSARNGGNKIDLCRGCREKVTHMAQEVRWIKDAHDKVDDGGVPLWYVPREWGRRVESIEDGTLELKTVLGSILVEIKRHNEIVLKLLDKNGRH